MRSCLVLLAVMGLVSAAGCKKDEEEKSEPATADVVTADVVTADVVTADVVLPSSEDVSEAITLVPGGKLVDQTEKGEGGTWTYAYENLEPLALAESQRAALEGAGWKTVLRAESLDGLPPPVLGVFASREGRLTIAQVHRDSSGAVQLKLIRESMQGLRMDPPDGYPAGFPFLPFGIPYEPKTPSTTRSISLVYNGELEGLRAELVGATTAAGWDCGNATFALLSGCYKDGTEVFVQLSSMSSNRQTLYVGQL